MCPAVDHLLKRNEWIGKLRAWITGKPRWLIPLVNYGKQTESRKKKVFDTWGTEKVEGARKENTKKGESFDCFQIPPSHGSC